MRRNLFLAVIAGLVSTGVALAAESYKVVEITEINDDTEYRVMSDTELATLKADIKIEERCFSKAYAAAAEEWKSINKSRIPIAQPTKGRSFRIEFSSANQETANKKMDDLLARKEKMADARMSRESKKAKAGKGMTEAEKERQEKKAERRAERDDALSIFKAKLDAVVAQEKEKAAKASEEQAKPADAK